MYSYTCLLSFPETSSEDVLGGLHQTGGFY